MAHRVASQFSSRVAPASPDFSGWNWVAHNAPDSTDGLIAKAHHGEDFVAAVEHGLISATQFHPEKSGDAGATLLENWLATL